eukprot:TRINITY_DN30889_c0_g1_i1.p1 TRINITY_DN30889_c0_g1~~TRINITY_DN30889_c0_g1_i1.p1  ORF type:complete len:650 (+),score=188.97 TRINITY_DN30889_c0_g1_i1:85-2034(+)
MGRLPDPAPAASSRVDAELAASAAAEAAAADAVAAAFRPRWRRTEGDPCTQSNFAAVATTHMDIDWRVDPQLHEVQGSVTLAMRALRPSVSTIVLDTKDLTVHEVLLHTQPRHVVLRWDLSPVHATLGSQALSIHLPDGVSLREGQEVSLQVSYQTTPLSSALCWLPPTLVGGSATECHLYSQCHGTHARALLPCQDTPNILATYAAAVAAPAELTVLMSAEQESSEEAVPGVRVTRFSRKQPLPSYLISLAACEVRETELSDSVSVWSAAGTDSGLSSLPDLAALVEGLLGPYAWGRINVLCLPACYPSGSSASPGVIFAAASSVAAGCESLCADLAKCWCSGLVAPRTWEDVFISESVATWAHRKVLGRLHGQDFYSLSAILGWDMLSADVARLGQSHPDTALRPPVGAADPDSALCGYVPSEKGFCLLHALERKVGSPRRFELWIRDLVASFQHRVIGAEDAVRHLIGYFAHTDHIADLSDVDWTTWMDAVGMPPVIPGYEARLADVCSALAAECSVGVPDPQLLADVSGWPPLQTHFFLSRLLLTGEPVPKRALAAIDAAHGFCQLPDDEMLSLWLRICVRAAWTGADSALREFLSRVGRTSLLRPLYRDASRRDRKGAQAMFTANRERYHAACAQTIARDLGLR